MLLHSSSNELKKCLYCVMYNEDNKLLGMVTIPDQ